jgi:hypothetical protein
MKKKSDESSAPRMNAPHQVRKWLRNERMRHLQFGRPGTADDALKAAAHFSTT